MAKSRQQLRQEQRKKKNKAAATASISVGVICAIVAFVVILAIVLIGFFLNRDKGEAENKSASSVQQQDEIVYDKEPQVSGEHDRAKFVMENGEEFIVELYPEYAPLTAANFKSLVEEGFYDGLTFHRVVDGFMAQGGDPNGDGTGGSAKAIDGEFMTNGFKDNTLSHQRGVISMARTNDPNSASSGFFICYDDASFLDGNYAAFGKVIEGMEVIDSFLEVERSYNSLGEQATPTTPIIIKSATIIK